MIFVDDCGTDDSMDRVRGEAKVDPRIRILKNERNMGPGTSRNRGIEVAYGEYLSFVDPDDYVAPDFLEKLYTEASRGSFDIVKGSVTRESVVDSGVDYVDWNKSIRSGLASGRPLYLLFRSEHYSAIYRRQFIASSSVMYGNTRRGEDTTFLLQACSQAGSFSLIDTARYHHQERLNSATNRADAIMLRELIQSIHEQVNYVLFNLSDNNWIREWARIRFAYAMRVIDVFRDTLNTKEEVLPIMESIIRSEWMRLPFHEDFLVCVSVIIPVWNPGRGISHCIESLRNQTLKEIEMIFIDDCGTDDSMDMVRAAAAKDMRIRVLKNRENMGAGDSRNRGIEAARGEYISFVDPDDYIAPDFLEMLYTEACRESYDIVKGTQIRVAKDGCRLTRNLNQIVNSGLARGTPLFLMFTYEHQSAIYRREFLLSNNIRYGSSWRAQDHIFLLRACCVAKSISLKDEACYYFCERDDSSMHTLGAKSLQGCADAVRDQVDYVLEALPHNKYTELFLINLFNVFLREYELYDRIPDMKEETGHYLDRLQEELLRIPYCDCLAERSYPLKVLLDYGIGIPAMPYFSPWEERHQVEKYVRLMKRWSDFCTAHHEEKKACNEILTGIHTRMRSFKSDDNICKKEDNTKWIDLVERWIDVFLSNPSNPDLYWKEMSRMIFRAMKGVSEDVNSSYLLKEQVKRLPLLYPDTPPTHVRIDASTVCQLKCEGCGFQRNNHRGLGRGFLSAENFRRFLEDNPQIERVELSNYGELFLNPELIDIMRIAHEKGVELEARMGSNFNSVSEEQLNALVDYQFRFISLSIDGATQESYAKYRRGGSFDTVIQNIQKLQRIKETKNSKYPELLWQFVLTEYDEKDIPKAKKMAEELGIPIFFKLNFMRSYKPVDPEFIKKETGLDCVTRQEYLEKYNISYAHEYCYQMFNDPQINWDGRLLGCSMNEYGFKANVFDEGLLNAINSDEYVAAKEVLLMGQNITKTATRIECFYCPIRTGSLRCSEVFAP